ncbi:phenylalanine--tRNA ligase beta subunit-related protein [Geminicoccaceae bacterium 1502E]|nr:phenylalanine--tRNA ligase beta subunit-related protein [Geminicoccaceae bacterium 1502E]
MLEIVLDPALAGRGVRPRLACLAARVAIGPAGPELTTAIDEEAARVRADPALPPAVTATRRALKALGKDPSRYRPAAEALRRRLAQGKDLWRVSNLVDLNNLVSLRSGLSIGTYDMARLSPPLCLRQGLAGESYAGIGRGPLNLEGLPVLADGNGPFGSPVSDSEPTRVSETTREALMVLFGFSGNGDGREVLEEATALAAEGLRAWCGAGEVTCWRVEG